MKKLILRVGAALGALAAAPVAFAGTSTDTTFEDFRDTVVGWAEGPLGTGLAVTMMLMGAGMGVARNSPMPALSGIAAAAFINWGPGIIESLTDGAMLL